MNYHDRLQKYKDGVLTEEEKHEIEKDIEKQDAISEYLFDQTMCDERIAMETDVQGAAVFQQNVQTSIRKAFVKMGIIVGSVLFALLLAVIFVLPKVTNAFFYDPTEIVGERDGYPANRGTVDIATFTELFFPGRYRFSMNAIPEGYGKYNIHIDHNFYHHSQQDVAGRIIRNQLTLYDPNVFAFDAINVFVPDLAGVTSTFSGEGAAGSPQQAKERLSDLDPELYYRAFFTLDSVYSYDAFIHWKESESIDVNWMTLTTKDNIDGSYQAHDPLGFSLGEGTGMISFGYDEEKYPLLSLYDFKNAGVTEQNAKTHVTSLLKYTKEHPEFIHMFRESYDPTQLLENIEQKGIHTYGFVVIAQQKEIQRIAGLDSVAYVYTILQP